MPIDVLIMQNTSLLFENTDKHFCFDLKGSWVARHATIEMAETYGAGGRDAG